MTGRWLFRVAAGWTLGVALAGIAVACTLSPRDASPASPSGSEVAGVATPAGLPATPPASPGADAPPLNGGEPAATPFPGSTADAGTRDGSPKSGDVLVLANRGDPPSGFDPMRTSSIALHHVAGAIFGPGNLVMRCRENMYLVCPYLATSWYSNLGMTEWTFTLRGDVQ